MNVAVKQPRDVEYLVEITMECTYTDRYRYHHPDTPRIVARGTNHPMFWLCPKDEQLDMIESIMLRCEMPPQIWAIKGYWR